MAADIEAPDKVLYGLTFRQLAILAAGAAGEYLAWRALEHLLPIPVLLGGAVVVGGVLFGLAVGRRDGLSLDRWLLAAVRHAHTPHALATAPTPSGPVPAWLQPPPGRAVVPAPLRLPADAIDADGQIRLPGEQAVAALTAAGTVNLALRTAAEQQALVEAFGRFCNALTGPTQIVISAQPVDLHGHAARVADTADTLPSGPDDKLDDGPAGGALRAACADHARFLHELAERRDPLHRQVLVVTRTAVTRTPAGSSTSAGRSARRGAESTARDLAGLGVATQALDGDAATAALAAAADPYRPARPGSLAGPDTTITTTQPTARPTAQPLTVRPTTHDEVNPG